MYGDVLGSDRVTRLMHLLCALPMVLQEHVQGFRHMAELEQYMTKEDLRAMSSVTNRPYFVVCKIADEVRPAHRSPSPPHRPAHRSPSPPHHPAHRSPSPIQRHPTARSQQPSKPPISIESTSPGAEDPREPLLHVPRAPDDV